MSATIVVLLPHEWFGPGEQQEEIRAISRVVGTNAVVVAINRPVWPWDAVQGRLGRKVATAKVREAENLHIVRPVLPIHESVAARSRLSSAVLRRVLMRQIWRFVEESGGGRPVVLWVYAPYHFRLVDRSEADLFVYEVYDEYGLTRTGGIRRFESQLDELATRSADIVFTTSAPLAARRSHSGVKPIVVGNGVPPWYLGEACGETPADVAGIPRPRAVVVANFGNWIDYELLDLVFSRLTGVSLVLIGAGLDRAGPGAQNLLKLRNVFWLGVRRPKEIPAYLDAMDIGLVPYVQNRFIDTVWPLKVNEYLARGLPVIMTPCGYVPCAAIMSEGIVDVVNGAKAMEEAVARFVGGVPASIRQGARRVAAAYSWDRIAALEWSHISSALKQ